MTASLGIFQGDIAIRTAIIQGFRELRADSSLLDYCFAWLPQDELTAKRYGTKTAEAAKKWFLENDINVSLDVRVDSAKLPMVTITLAEGAEDSATLGDVNYEPGEDGPLPGMATNLESVRHRETYTLGLYTAGEPELLLILQSVTLFVLYRYKKRYLEGRGFEVSTVQGGKLSRVEALESQPTFGRPINVTGFVRHFWPAKQGPKVTDFKSGVLVADGGKSPDAVDLTDPMWSMDKDITVI